MNIAEKLDVIYAMADLFEDNYISIPSTVDGALGVEGLPADVFVQIAYMYGAVPLEHRAFVFKFFSLELQCRGLGVNPEMFQSPAVH